MLLTNKWTANFQITKQVIYEIDPSTPFFTRQIQKVYF